VSPDEDRVSGKSARSFAERAERSLRDVERFRKAEDTSPTDRAMLQLEQAKVLALLDLADALRASGRSER
jgi:hypothetical protein